MSTQSHKDNIENFHPGWSKVDLARFTAENLCFYGVDSANEGKAYCTTSSQPVLKTPSTSLSFMCAKANPTNHGKKCYVKYTDKFPNVCVCVCV